MRKFVYILLLSCSACSGLCAQDRKTEEQDTAYLSDDERDDQADQKVDTSLFFSSVRVAPDTVQRWKNLKAFEYARYLDSLLKESEKKEKLQTGVKTSSGPGWLDRLLSSSATSIFFWSLAIAFVLFILYRLFIAEGFFKRNSKASQTEVNEVKEEILSGTVDFDNRINQAIAGGNYRLAVRFQYLKTLHRLADRRYIELAADKTNFQYVREINNRDYQNEFSSLTLSYEFVWYGEFQIDEHLYSKIAPRFSGFNQKIQPGN